jgi:hypothetical protein
MPWRIGLFSQTRGTRARSTREGLFFWSVDALTNASDSDPDSDPDSALEPSDRLRRFFDSCCALAFGILVAVALEKIFPGFFAWTYNPGYRIGDNLVALFGASIWWLLRVGLVLGFSGAFISRVLRAFPTFRWVAYPLLVLLYLLFLFHGISPLKKEARARSAEAAKESVLVSRQQAAEEQEREQLAWRRNALAERLIINWRGDVEYLGAIGKPGEVPKTLKVTELREQVEVANLSDRPMDLAMARVKPSSGGGYERCLFDNGNVIRIGPHGSYRFQIPQGGSQPGCMDGMLEFRVGEAGSEDLPWWSKSALQDVAEFTPPLPTTVDTSLETLRAQIADLERRVDDKGRADRWRARIQTGQ